MVVVVQMVGALSGEGEGFPETGGPSDETWRSSSLVCH